MSKYIVKNGILVRDKSTAGVEYVNPQGVTIIKTRDVAFTYRMGAGFAGTVNRSHPASINPYLKDATYPPTFFGQAVVMSTSTNSVRAIIAGDSAITDIFGVVVRPFPFQGVTAPTGNYAGSSTTWGSGTLPDGAVDILTSGFILVPVNGTTAMGGVAYVYYGTSTGAHVQSSFEAASGSNIAGLTGGGYSTLYNSPPDSNGVAELRFHV
jgi:hypothetical protein